MAILIGFVFRHNTVHYCYIFCDIESACFVFTEHRACYSYVGKIGQDLSFEAGDKIIIYEILDNGWWLGSKGKNVGWLPGTYVQVSVYHTILYHYICRFLSQTTPVV